MSGNWQLVAIWKKSLSLTDVSPDDHPPCETCKYGRQVRKPDGTTTTTKNPEKEGALKRDKLKPGQLVFCDQLESRIRGRLLHTAGREPDSSKFCSVEPLFSVTLHLATSMLNTR